MAAGRGEQRGFVPRLTREQASAFIGLIRAGETLDRRLDQDLRRTNGLSLRAYEVLLHLAAFGHQGCARMSQLTDQAPLSQSRVSRLVAQLEADGLVERRDVAEDFRQVDVQLTDEGERRLRRAHDDHLASLEEHFFSLLSDTEVRQLARITAKLLDRG